VPKNLLSKNLLVVWVSVMGLLAKRIGNNFRLQQLGKLGTRQQKVPTLVRVSAKNRMDKIKTKQAAKRRIRKNRTKRGNLQTAIAILKASNKRPKKRF